MSPSDANEYEHGNGEEWSKPTSSYPQQLQQPVFDNYEIRPQSQHNQPHLAIPPAGYPTPSASASPEDISPHSHGMQGFAQMPRAPHGQGQPQFQNMNSHSGGQFQGVPTPSPTFPYLPNGPPGIMHHQQYEQNGMNEAFAFRPHAMHRNDSGYGSYQNSPPNGESFSGQVSNGIGDSPFAHGSFNPNMPPHGLEYGPYGHPPQQQQHHHHHQSAPQALNLEQQQQLLMAQRNYSAPAAFERPENAEDGQPGPSTSRKRKRNGQDEVEAVVDPEEAKRQQGLERNRNAAAKCRQNKKQEEQAMLTHKNILQMDNEKLKIEFGQLRNLVLSLRNMAADEAMDGNRRAADGLRTRENDPYYRNMLQDPTNTSEINALKDQLTGTDRELLRGRPGRPPMPRPQQAPAARRTEQEAPQQLQDADEEDLSGARWEDSDVPEKPKEQNEDAGDSGIAED